MFLPLLFLGSLSWLKVLCGICFVQELSKGGPKPKNLPEKEDCDEADKQRDETNKNEASLYLVNACK